MATATATAPALTPPAWKPSHNPWAVALTVTLATFMEVLDTSIANVALPHMAGSLGASRKKPPGSSPATSCRAPSFFRSPAGCHPLWRKRFYMTCVVIFTICSFLCGIAPIAAHAHYCAHPARRSAAVACAQRAGHPRRHLPRSKRGQAFAVYGMAVVVAPAIGPTLGGWITDNFNWHWIFFINIPFGLLSLFLSNRMVEDPPFSRGAPENQRSSPRSTLSASASWPSGSAASSSSSTKARRKTGLAIR